MFGGISLLTYVKIGAVALVVATSFYMGKVWEKSVWQAKELAMQKTIDEQRKHAEKVAYEYETELQRLRTNSKEVVREVFIEVNKPVYACPLPADGLRIINKAINAANASKP